MRNLRLYSRVEIKSKATLLDFLKLEQKHETLVSPF